ncbi:MAG: hypothetical protein QOD41_4105 [Cryptosporangiaceae bacterium]|nr:hypothetical protein [Cryptosporangiaceae bacterium]
MFAVTCGVLGAAVIAPVGASAEVAALVPRSGTGEGTYLVQLADEPVASYQGSIPGLVSTRPSAGAKVDPSAPKVRSYLGHLTSRRDAVLRAVPGARKLYDYNYAFAGFAAHLTGTQAAALARAPGVATVTKDEIRHLDTISTPSFLGLTGPTGVWERQTGGPAGAGDGVVIASIDSGLWPENPSFAAHPVTGSDAKVRKHFRGTCDAGLEAPSFTCNNKVVGGRYYVRGVGPDNIVRAEYLSPRGYSSHGSHTAGIAAGNHDVPAVVEGHDLGSLSGMAPAARIAVYKVCWIVDDKGDDRCATSDSVAAIDQAVADGADVINYSISGSRTSAADPVELAFFRAAQAGVFVAASAGNNGPSVTTVGHNSPWVTTVAAGTHDRSASASLSLGNGQSYTGVGIGAAVPSSPLILAKDAGRDGAPANEVALCFLGRLDPAKVAGKIVVCDRGTNDRPDKSREVRDEGGVGMILANVSSASLNADIHYVPTIHVDQTAGAAIKAYVTGTASATAQFAPAVVGGGAPAPKVAAFSSRGPALAGSGDLLKPDLMAPGADVLSAVTPPEDKGRNWDLESGSSMAAPHVAGLAALIAGKRPRWSPMAIKSALMTSAVTTDNTGQPITTDAGGLATARDYGAGEVNPSRAFNPGLVYDSAPTDWNRYLCALGERPVGAAECGPAGDPSDLNGPSIAIGALPGVQTVTRTVTGVDAHIRTYTADVDEPPGVDVTVSPPHLTVRPGERASFTVTINRVSAPFEEYAFGSLTWKTKGHSVRSPIAVRPVAIAVPQQLAGSGADGSVDLPVATGYDGDLHASITGLVPSATYAATLSDPVGAPFPTTAPAQTAHTAKFTISVPAGTKLERFALFDGDHPAGSDVDLFAYRAGTKASVGASTGKSAEERIDLANASGSYDVYAELYSIGGDRTSLDLTLHVWSLGGDAAGNVIVDPAVQPVLAGGSTTVKVRWSGLDPARRWLGRVAFTDGGTATGATVIRVDS